MNSNNKYPNIEKCNPSFCISGKIMKCNRIVAKIFRKYLMPYNITDSQLSILFVITKKKEITSKKISDMLCMDKSTISRNLRRLIEKKYISKKGGFYLSITDHGKQLLEEVIPEWEKAMFETRQIIGNEGENSLNILLTQLIN